MITQKTILTYEPEDDDEVRITNSVAMIRTIQEKDNDSVPESKIRVQFLDFHEEVVCEAFFWDYELEELFSLSRQKN